MYIQLIVIIYSSGLVGSAPPPANKEQINTSELVTFVSGNSMEVQTKKILNLIKYINQGNMIVNDICEMMEERVGLLTGSDKPNCRYNASFISDTDIHLFDVAENVRKFFLKRKQESCKQSNSGCGELTIILKLVDLINSIVHISFKVSSMDDLFKNVETVSFYELFDAYQSSLNDPEILANITLKMDRVNLILERERVRIKKINRKTHTDHFFDGVNYYIGAPVKASFCYLGDTVGSTVGTLFGSAIEQTTGGLGLSGENKTILIGLSILYILKR